MTLISRGIAFLGSQFAAQCADSPEENAPKFNESPGVVLTPVLFEFLQQDTEISERLPCGSIAHNHSKPVDAVRDAKEVGRSRLSGKGCPIPGVTRTGQAGIR